jgi:glycosyltransferase involved in cell wall biosynthesis
MRVIIYESSSFGGCYEYSVQLCAGYTKNSYVKKCSLLLAKNSKCIFSGVHKILLPDIITKKNKLSRKLHFLLRTFINPFILFFYLRNEKSSFVLFNDFEQLSALVWVPFFKLFLRKHCFAVFLHDPDRDDYPPSKWFSGVSMKKMMSLMDFAFFHEFLPERKYYNKNSVTKYLPLPHGIYPKETIDEILFDSLSLRKTDNQQFFSILGNIRAEKNYEPIIKVLKKFPEIVLIIAGKPANSEIDTTYYKNIASQENVDNRIIWIERYLSNEELAAVISVSDVILLYYAKTFASQSAILNMIAPYKKNILVANGESSLAQTTRKFEIGLLVKPDSIQCLEDGMKKIIELKNTTNPNWDKYLKFASWSNHVQIVIDALKESKGI